ncbi:MAG: tyrosinase family protein [Rhizomicrobium sp.]
MQTRRRFIGTATALAALSLAPARAAVAGPVRMSLPAFASDATRVAALRNGIAAMKALPASDHRSYFFQAATHAYSDALLKPELKRDPGLKTVDRGKYWNQCPHFGQCSADFVIWHRAYLHFFERTLRAATGDESFALPYWDYTVAEQRTFPEIYAPEFLDDKSKLRNPLFHPNREKAFTRGLLEISALVGQAEKTVGAATFFHEVGAPGFGGDDLDEDRTQVGLLEQRPHNDIHLAVGGVINSANGAMAEITTAAFDPVFWVHHANIDRMWAAWAAQPGKSWGKAPAPEWFDEAPWTFIDADGSEMKVSRRDAIGLLAAYDVDYGPQLAVPEPSPPPPPAAASGGGSAATPPRVGASPLGGAAPAGRRHARAPRRPAERELAADRTPMTVTPHNAGHRLFGEAVPAAARNGASYATRSAAQPTLDAPELSDPDAKVLLELSGISFGLVPSSGFAVYLDCAGRPASDPVGLIDIFGATHHRAMAGMGPMKAAQRFDVTAIVRQGSSPFTVRVEPYDLLVTRDGKPTRGRADAVQIAAVRFVVIG